MTQKFTPILRSALFVLLGVAILSLAIADSPNAQGFKLGVIDVQMVVESYQKAISADQELKTLQDRLVARLKILEDEIITMEERLAKQELFLDEQQVQTAKADILRKQQEYRQKLETGQQTLMEKQKELLEPILKEVKDQISEIGKADGFSLILDKQAALFVAPEYDLTKSVIDRLNAQKTEAKSENNE